MNRKMAAASAAVLAGTTLIGFAFVQPVSGDRNVQPPANVIVVRDDRDGRQYRDRDGRRDRDREERRQISQALDKLRDAKYIMEHTKGDFKGHKKRALDKTKDAIKELQTILDSRRR